MSITPDSSPSPSGGPVVLAAQDTAHVTGGGSDRNPLDLPEDFLPDWLDYHSVADDLEDDGVSAPEGMVDDLRDVVATAADNGLDLKIVITEDSPSVYTDARDLATTLGQEYDGTIFVRTPAFNGSHSDTVARAMLEAGEIDAYRESDPVSAAVVFESQASAPPPPWGLYGAAILGVLVIAVAVFAVLLRRRATGSR